MVKCCKQSRTFSVINNSCDVALGWQHRRKKIKNRQTLVAKITQKVLFIWWRSKPNFLMQCCADVIFVPKSTARSFRWQITIFTMNSHATWSFSSFQRNIRSLNSVNRWRHVHKSQFINHLLRFFLDLNLFVPLITRLNCKLPQKNFISLQNHSKHAKDIVWQRKMYSLYCQVMCDKLTCSQSINSNTAAAKTVTLWTKLQTSNYRDDNSVCWCWQEA